MNKISAKHFGMAFGITSALLYLGCMLIMVIFGKEGTIDFFNSLMHGLDVSPIIRMNISLWEAAIGIVEIFIISWIAGACIAWIYNLKVRK